jgi:hypothetical protein
MNQTDATVSQVYYFTFMYSLTCFGRLHAHYQKLTTALTASGFDLERGDSSVVSRGLARPRLTTLLQPRSNGKTRGC